MRFIERDALYKDVSSLEVVSYFRKSDDFDEGVNFILEKLDAIPEVKFVYCKHCKHRGFDECPMYHEEWYDYDDDGYLESDVHVYDYTEDDGFCHKGEFEEDGD